MRVFAVNQPLADDASVKPSEDYWHTGLLLASLEWAALQSLWVGGIGQTSSLQLWHIGDLTVFILEQVLAGSMLEASKYQVLEAPF